MSQLPDGLTMPQWIMMTVEEKNPVSKRAQRGTPVRQVHQRIHTLQYSRRRTDAPAESPDCEFAILETDPICEHYLMDTGRCWEEEPIQIVTPGEEGPSAVLRSGDEAEDDESASASVSSSGRTEREAEEIPLIPIRVFSDRIKPGDSEPVSPDQPQCRICLEPEGDDLIAPCRCRGTQKYVHRSCLDNWRAAKEGFAFAHCTECRSAFYLRANLPPDRWWLRLKFQLLVLRDHAAIFLIVQLVVGCLGASVYYFYGEELREMFGYEHHPYGFYALVVVVALLVGLLYGFFIAIICGQNISNRHYHILAKQELTKEYIVENLSEDGDPPQLDPGHLNELKMLGLF
ncbi:hypothetical protein R1flu_020144 [Riccia fluitans]|uniref:RING-CH-type domain-containing protein n=1 Tax=Riccia fluitans TaxID=41844 RepID=A0ABD1ZMD1_9MARC